MLREEEGDIREGVLVCPTTVCQREHPIIDGIPIIVPDIAQFVRDNESHLLARDDLSTFTAGMFADCLGGDSTLSYTRSVLSSYAYGHYHLEGGLRALLDQGTKMLSSPPAGLWLDAVEEARPLREDERLVAAGDHFLESRHQAPELGRSPKAYRGLRRT